MTVLYDWLLAPFLDFAFMQRALFGSLLLSFASCPVGVFLMLRRMSLTGDAMAHGILPGAAAGFLLFGLQIVPMTIGGLVAGMIVALGSGAVARFTVQKEDASMAAFYLTPDWEAARRSVQQLAALNPELVVTGHGPALRGAEMQHALHRLADEFESIATPRS